jgi:hypothetical protein
MYSGETRNRLAAEAGDNSRFYTVYMALPPLLSRGRGPKIVLE